MFQTEFGVELGLADRSNAHESIRVVDGETHTDSRDYDETSWSADVFRTRIGLGTSFRLAVLF